MPDKDGTDEPGQRARVIVKVNVAGHVPKGFAVRTRIDDCFFTANATAKALADAEKDPAVVSVAKARLLRRID